MSESFVSSNLPTIVPGVTVILSILPFNDLPNNEYEFILKNEGVVDWLIRTDLEVGVGRASETPSIRNAPFVSTLKVILLPPINVIVSSPDATMLSLVSCTKLF